MKLLQQLTDYLFWQDMLRPEELSALSALGIRIPNRRAGHFEGAGHYEVLWVLTDGHFFEPPYRQVIRIET